VRNQRHEGMGVVARSLRTQQRAYGRNPAPGAEVQRLLGRHLLAARAAGRPNWLAFHP